MTLSSVVPLILLLLMGRSQSAPPPWPGQRRPRHGQQPRGRTVSHHPRVPQRPAPRPSGHLPGFIPPDLLHSTHPILTSMPVGPGVAIPRPVHTSYPTRPIDHLPIRSPGQPTAPRPPSGGPPPEMHVPEDVLHPPLPHLPHLPEMPVEDMPEVVITPIETGPEVPEPEHDDEPAGTIAVIRAGEGLYQMTKRVRDQLGLSTSLADMRELRTLNVLPNHGPDHDWKVNPSTGNPSWADDPKRGLQEGDSFFVPDHWVHG